MTPMLHASGVSSFHCIPLDEFPTAMFNLIDEYTFRVTIWFFLHQQIPQILMSILKYVLIVWSFLNRWNWSICWYISVYIYLYFQLIECMLHSVAGLCTDQSFLSLCHPRRVVGLSMLYNVNSNSNHCLFWEHPSATTRVIIIIKIESAVQGRERVRTLHQSKDPNPTQPTRGRKKKRK